jgi:hypothetical protein
LHILRPRRSGAGVLLKGKSSASHRRARDQRASHSWDSPVSHSP